MYSKTLTFNVRLEVPQAELTISDNNIDFIISKSVDCKPDIANINIWNLDEKIYNSLTEKPYQINFYSRYSDEEAALLFSGYIDFKNTKRQRYLNDINSEQNYIRDMITSIKLADSSKTYQETYINKIYRESVTSTRIINDCIEAAGLGSVISNSELPEKLYSTYKAVGKPHLIIKRIFDSLNVPFLIRDGIIYIGQNTNKNTPDIPVFDLTNSLEPKIQDNNTALIITKFMPELKPNNLVKCNFENLNGTFLVLKIEFFGNNYDTNSMTKIYIGV